MSGWYLQGTERTIALTLILYLKLDETLPRHFFERARYPLFFFIFQLVFLSKRHRFQLRVVLHACS